MILGNIACLPDEPRETGAEINSVLAGAAADLEYTPLGGQPVRESSSNWLAVAFTGCGARSSHGTSAVRANSGAMKWRR